MTDTTRPSPVDSPVALRLQQVLRLKGLAEEGTLVTATGLSGAEVAGFLSIAAGAGIVSHRSGRVGGWHLTAAGRKDLVARLEEERTLLDHEGLDAAYLAFIPLNTEFKAYCTRWQHETEPEAAVGEYVAELDAIHLPLAELLRTVAAYVKRFDCYERRFSSARDRFAGGEVAALVRPLSDSYHDVWMELHQDLLSTLGRQRSEADGH